MGPLKCTYLSTLEFHRSYCNEAKGIQFLLWRQMVGSAPMKIKINPETDKNLNRGF